MKTENFINGKWADSSDKTENINPSDTSDIIGRFALASSSQLEEAICAAKKAQPGWDKTGLEDRRKLLFAVGQTLMAQSAAIGEIISREEGKPIAEGKGEAYRAGQFFDYYAAEVMRQLGDNADSVRPGIEVDVRKEPVGVVAVISPWNFPLAAACWKIAPALAFGNAVVWKPATLTPASAVALAKIFEQHNAPAGIFNMVAGSGAQVGDALAAHPDVDAISFTGSLETGQKIAASAAKNLTKLQMEMGSKNPLLIMDDADMQLAVSCAAGGAFGGTGQKCTASSRLIVHRAVLQEFTEKLTQAAKKLKVGHALDAETQMGPVASKEQLRSNLQWMQTAKSEGAEHLCGGEELSLKQKGYYMSPALFSGDNKMTINREEMFAPAACIIPADNYEQALSIANDTKYGLTAGIITKSLSRAVHFRRNAKFGCIMTNLATAGTDYHVPFGGRNQSSHGPREQGRVAVEFYTTTKTAYTSAGDPE